MWKRRCVDAAVLRPSGAGSASPRVSIPRGGVQAHVSECRMAGWVCTPNPPVVN